MIRKARNRRYSNATILRARKPEAHPVAPSVDVSAYEAQIVRRDGRIKEPKLQVAEAARTAEATEMLKSQIKGLKAQGEPDRIEFELRLAGARNVKAVRAILDVRGGDVSALKEAGAVVRRFTMQLHSKQAWLIAANNQ